MLLATSVNLVPAAIARGRECFPSARLAFFGLTDLFRNRIGNLGFPRTRATLSVTLWGGLLIIVSQPLRLAVSSIRAGSFSPGGDRLLS